MTNNIVFVPNIQVQSLEEFVLTALQLISLMVQIMIMMLVIASILINGDIIRAIIQALVFVTLNSKLLLFHHLDVLTAKLYNTQLDK
jgi:hypothetical protein